MTTLAIDLGTSAIKFLRVDSNLHEISLDRVPVSGLDVEFWLDALASNLITHGDGAQIRRIAITGQMHGLVTLETTGYDEGIPWTDQRGSTMLPWLESHLDPAISQRIGGPLASGFQAVSLAWIRQHQPGRWRQIRKVMLPKDALIHALTGKHVTDPSDAVGTGMFDTGSGTWNPHVLDIIGIPGDWLPHIVPSGTNVGPVHPDIATRLGLNPQACVIIAGGDAPVAAVGGGVTQPGQALIMLSSGAQLILPTMSREPDSAQRWYTWPAAMPSGSEAAPFLQVGTLLNAGLAITWLQDILATPYTITPEPTNLIALPHLIGERAPLRDPDARGAILGIGPDTIPGDIHRALLEGIAFSLRHALEVMCENTALPFTIRLGGGGAQDDTWQAIITNVLGIPTARIATTELSAWGAAGIANRQPAPTQLTQEMQPDSQLREKYDVRYHMYREALEAFTPISHRLARLDVSG